MLKSLKHTAFPQLVSIAGTMMWNSKTKSEGRLKPHRNFVFADLLYTFTNNYDPFNENKETCMVQIVLPSTT